MLLPVATAGCSLNRSKSSGTQQFESTSSIRLRQAESLLGQSQFDMAAAKLQSVVDGYPGSPEAPTAQFQLAVLYLAPDSPLRDAPRGIRLLRDLVADYPSSSWTLASKAILKLVEVNADLRQVAAELNEQLDLLKQIDIGIDG